MGILQKFRSWLDHKLKNGIYELQGDEIVSGRGERPKHRLAIGDVGDWQIFPEMGFDVVVIKLVDGRQLRWIDKYDDLIAILRKVAPDREKSDRVV